MFKQEPKMYTKQQKDRYLLLVYGKGITNSREAALTYLRDLSRQEDELNQFRTLMEFVHHECGLNDPQVEEIKQQEADTIDLLRKLRSKFTGARREGFGEYESFYNWYIEQKQECYYCKIKVDTIRYLLDNNIIHERLNRGRSLEIEKLNPAGQYCRENCVLACYFCNNDKSQIFTVEQYKLFANPTARKKYLEDLVKKHKTSKK